MYKIVDDFNGFEDHRRFEDMADAEKALEADREKFFYRPENTGSECRLDIVTADLSWTWDQRQNRFRWW